VKQARCVGATVLAVLLMVQGVAEAARGVVAYKRGRCDYYIVNAGMGYALLEWYGGNDPSEGDQLAGDFESYGMKTIQNLTADSETQVWVEEYALSRSSVIEQYRRNCRLD
jgi:hypothetical protein